MANFLSAPKTFTPYIPRFDTELYGKIGMGRQQEYNQNVEQIQSYVSSIAGFQVSNQADQKYLTSKVDELRTNLQSMGNADFSRNQVMGRARGMAQQIASDKVIQTAVRSTANLQKDLEAIKLATKEGKAAPSNTNHITKRINSYMNSQEAGTSYNESGYTPYYNRDEAFAKSYKDKYPNVKMEETPTSYNADGTPNYRAYVLENNEIKYINPATVAQDYKSWIQNDMQAQQQLQFDAEYYSDNTSTEGAATILKTSHDATLAEIDKSLNTYSQLIATSTGDKQKQAQQYYDMVNAQKSEMQSTYQNSIQQLESDPESFKRGSYMQSVVAGIANRYSFSEQKKSYKENPQANMEMKAQAQALAFSKFEYDQTQDTFDNDMKIREYNLKLKEYELKTLPKPGEQLILGVDLGIPGADNPIKTFEDYSENLVIEGAQVAQSQIQLVGQIEDDKPADQQANRTTRFNPSTGAYVRTSNTGWEAVYNNAKIQYFEDPNLVSAPIKQYFSANGDRDFEFSAKRSISDRYSKEIEDLKKSDPNIKIYEDNKKTVANKVPEKGVEISPYRYNTDFRVKVTRGMMSSYIDQYNKSGEENINNFDNEYGQGAWASTRTVHSSITGGKPVVRRSVSQNTKDREAEIAGKLIETFPSRGGSVNIKDAKDSNLYGLITQLAENQTTGSGNKGNVEISLGKVKNPQTVGFVRNGATNDFYATVYGVEGTKSEPLKISADNMIRLGQQNLVSPNTGSVYTTALQANEEVLDSKIRGTTIGRMAPQLNANMPSSTKYSIQGWIRYNENAGVYVPVIRYKDKTNHSNNWKQVDIPSAPGSENQFTSPEAAINGLYKIYNLDPETFENAVLN